MRGEKGVIVFDADDVVYDFVPVFLEHVRKNFPHIERLHKLETGMQLGRNVFTRYSLSEVTGCSKQVEFDAVHSFYASPEFASLPLMPGAKEVFQELKGMNYRSLVSTSRPNTVRDITEAAFHRDVPGIIGEFHFASGQLVSGKGTTSKGAFCYERKARFFVDDSWRHIDCCLDNGNGTVPIISSAPWNVERNELGVPRADSMYDVLEIVRGYDSQS